MKRFIEIKGTIQECHYNPTSWSLDVEVTPEDTMDFYKNLQAILFEEASSFTIKPSQEGKAIKFHKALDEKTRIECLQNKYHIHLSKSDLESIASYLSTYFKGESSFQGHLDIEMEHAGPLGPDATMIFAISKNPI